MHSIACCWCCVAVWFCTFFVNSYLLHSSTCSYRFPCLNDIDAFALLLLIVFCNFCMHLSNHSCSNTLSAFLCIFFVLWFLRMVPFNLIEQRTGVFTRFLFWFLLISVIGRAVKMTHRGQHKQSGLSLGLSLCRVCLHLYFDISISVQLSVHATYKCICVHAKI